MEPASAIVLVVYAVVAAAVAYRLCASWDVAFVAPIDRSARRLLSAVALYLAVPAAVLVSGLAQLAVLRASGGALGHFRAYVYWSVLEPASPDALAPLTRATIAATGPMTLAAIALALAVYTAQRPGSAALNHLRVESVRLLLLLVFGLHPLLSLTLQRGDFFVIDGALDARHPESGAVALLGYGILAAYAFFAWRRAEALRFSTTALHDDARAAARRLAQHPSDADALLTLGRARRAAGDPRATSTLERAAAAAPEDARIELALARALLGEGASVSAAKHLVRAGRRLEAQGGDAVLLHEVTLALSAARIAHGDTEGALTVADAARDQDPRDVRAPILRADALVAGGRRDEAERELVAALPSADGEHRREIRRRLAALRRSQPK